MSAKILKTVFVLFLMFFITGGGCQNEQQENMDYSTVQQLDLERYMGVWYEIARFNHSFERDLVRVTATYELRPDGKIKVINQGYKGSFSGKLKKAEGKVKQPNPGEPGKLKVSFFLFFYADYFILELDEGYKWALVGSSSDKYLWILSRTPFLENETLNRIMDKARQRGYDTSKLIWVEQKRKG
jgi:apolipoprotein D and lipocalin family protein